MTDPLDRTALSHGPGATDDEAYCSACNKSYSPELTVCPSDGARLVKLKAAKDALLGRVFDNRFEIRASLGQGGMGTVYRAHQLSVDREVAIKVIHPKLGSDRTAVKRFLREARLASRLSQPSIVNVFDFGQTDDGILYLAMELLRGHTLAHELRNGALPLRRVTTIALQLCDALEVAHREGIVHRDLKPGNIVLLDDPPGRDLIKVLDFGLAKSLVSDTSSLTASSDAMLGTPLYMPPEQVDGRPSDHRADLYALGCILHHMLSGSPPFLRETVNLVLSAHLDDPPPPLGPDIPPELAALVLSLLAKEPAQRPASASAVREVIQRVVETGFAARAGSVPPAAPKPTAGASLALAETAASQPDPAPAPASRPRRRLLIAVVGALAIGAGAGWLAMRGGDQHGAAAPAAVTRDAATSEVLVDASGVAQAAVDAAVAIDAPAPRPLIDAAPRRPSRADAALAPPAVPIDAPAAVPPADAAAPRAELPVDAPPPPAKPDAGPRSLDFIHPTKK